MNFIHNRKKQQFWSNGINHRYKFVVYISFCLNTGGGGKKGRSWWSITFDSSEDEDDAGILTSFWKKFATGVKKRFANLKTSFG